MSSSTVFTRPATVQAPPLNYMSLTIVGSGASTGVPVIGHMDTKCACADAIENPMGKNKRNNVSLLITLPVSSESATGDGDGADGTNNNSSSNKSHDEMGDTAVRTNTINGQAVRFVLIDCGKTFREAYFNVLVKHNVQLVDALCITHGHADAVAGLDDMRDMQKMHMKENGDWIIDNFIPTYAHRDTIIIMEERYAYIMRNSQIVGQAPPDAASYEAMMSALKARLEKERGNDSWNSIGIRRSAALDIFEISAEAPAPFFIPCMGSIPMYSVPVEHGKGYISLGFVFGTGTAFKSAGATRTDVEGKSCVAYISDISELTDSARQFLLDLVKIDVLITDCCLGPGRTNVTHMGADEMVAFVSLLRPTHAFAVGMYCDIIHDAGNAWFQTQLKEKVATAAGAGDVLSIELAYDGMELVLPQ